MTTIKHVEEQISTYQGKQKKSFKFTLSDEQVGYCANPQPWEFKEGDKVTYTKEVKKSTKGEYNVFTFSRVLEAATPPTTASGITLPEKTPLSPQHKINHKVEAAVKSMEFAMNALNEERLTWDKVLGIQKECVTALWSEIDEIYQTK